MGVDIETPIRGRFGGSMANILATCPRWPVNLTGDHRPVILAIHANIVGYPMTR